MASKMNEFFNEILISEPQNYVLFKKLYINPSQVFTFTMEDISKNDYYDYYLVYNFLLSNSYLKFLDVALDDEEYVTNKLNYCILRAMQCTIFDSEYFAEDIDEKFLYRYSRDDIQNIRLSESFRNSLPLYKSEYEKRKEAFNFALSSRVCSKLLNILNQKEAEEIRPLKERAIFYNRILYDDYNNPEKCAIYLCDFDDSRVLNALVCDNYFLEVVEEIFFNKKLSKVIIEKLIKILELSIQIASKRTLKSNSYSNYNYIIKKEKIEVYDIEKAEELLSKLKDLLQKELKEKTNVLFLNEYLQI